MGPVESGVRRQLVAASACGLIHQDLHAGGIAAALAAARAADEADNPGAAGYALAILGKQLQLLGLDAKTLARAMGSYDMRQLERSVAKQLDGETLRAVGGR